MGRKKKKPQIFYVKEDFCDIQVMKPAYIVAINHPNVEAFTPVITEPVIAINKTKQIFETESYYFLPQES